MRKCSTCEETKPLEAFYRDKSRPDGIALRCRSCRAAAYKGYVAKWQSAPVTIAQKWCNKCKRTLDSDCFAKDKHQPDGFSFYCRECRRAQLRKRRRSHDPSDWRLKRYGLTQDQFDLMIEAQDGKCAICQFPDPQLHVDHCHGTGRVRGLLCGQCNKAIGLLADSVELCKAAAGYLGHHCSPAS